MGFGFFKERASCSALAWMIQDGNFPMEKTGPFGRKEQKYVAITRPRRFGKTVMANMAAAYFGRGSNPADERPSCPVGYQTGELIWKKESTAVFPNPMKSNLKDGKIFCRKAKKLVNADNPCYYFYRHKFS